MPTEHRLQFTGSGREYFRIWIVNLTLSILTLGIYSAWAKVRREQYFHRHTLLDGRSFDYHGNPKSILKGRVIAVGCLVALGFIDEIIHAYYYPVLLLCAPLIPWLLIRSFIFRARNTSFGGLRFDFFGTYQDFCRTFLGYILFFFALGWLIDYTLEYYIKGFGLIRAVLLITILFTGIALVSCAFAFAFKRFQISHLAFGSSRFHLQCRSRSFYGTYLLSLWPFLVLIGLVILYLFIRTIGGMWLAYILHEPTYMNDTRFLQSLLFSLLSFFATLLNFVVTWETFIFLVLGYSSTLFTTPYLGALINNLTLNDTRLEDHRFVSDQNLRDITKIALSNWLLTLLTLGFYWPWAKVRMAVYRTQHIAVLAEGDIHSFAASVSEEKNAIGEEIAERFDFDSAL